MGLECLFCRAQLTDDAPVEHVPPAALGGWLTIRDVCGHCNSFFGHAVDRVADDQLLGALRYEVGLAPKRVSEGEFFDPHVDARRGGRILDDGTVAPVSAVHEHKDGRGFIISAATREETLKIAAKKQARAARDGRRVSFREIEPPAPAIVRLRLRHEKASPDEMVALLHREAAKVAIEYVALVAAPDVALLPQLDPLRSYARDGGKRPGVVTKYRGPMQVWLPRSKHLLLLGPNARKPSQEELDRMADELVPTQADGSLPEPDGVPAWTSFRHQLALQREGGGAWVELTLFEWLVTIVPLPPSLPLPWGCFDVRDCASGEITEHHPSGSRPVLLSN